MFVPSIRGDEQTKDARGISIRQRLSSTIARSDLLIDVSTY